MILKNWNHRAQKELAKLLKAAQTNSHILKRLRKLQKKNNQPLDWSITVSTIGIQAMKRLNWTYRKKKKETDVLSFPAPRPFIESGFLGELIICVPILKRQAKEFQHSEKQELKTLLVHGFLHLLGFDHETSKHAATEMAVLESELLQAVGLIGRQKIGKAVDPQTALKEGMS